MQTLGRDPEGRRPHGRGGGSAAARRSARFTRRGPATARRLNVEHVVRATGPYSLALCIWHANAATRHVRDGVLTTTVRVGETVEIASAQQLLDGRLVLRGESEAGIERLRFVLAIDDDHTPFLRRFARDPLLGKATREFQGMRVLRLPTVAQALLRAFCGQLIDTRRARELEYTIIRGTCESVDGSLLYAPPTAKTFAQLAPSHLRRLGLHARRGAALVRLCRSLDLERLRAVPTDVVAARLERERGVGPWTVGVVCLEGLGRTERGLVGDLSLVKLMSDLRGRWVDRPETADLLTPYGEWAGLASVYLTLGYHHGLVPLPGASRAQKPPAFFRARPAVS